MAPQIFPHHVGLHPNKIITVGTLGPSVSLELEPARGGLIIQCERYPY